MDINNGSIIVPSYATGEYFATHADPDQDAPFKADAFLKLFHRVVAKRPITIGSYVDVGCGGGRTASLIARGLRDAGHPLEAASGYDVFPGVDGLHQEGVEFVCGDFCQAEVWADLATLFDVAEHVPNTLDFLKSIASKCYLLAMHIPLDNSMFNSLFNRFRSRLAYPKHVLVLDVATALNLMTLAGIMPLDYDFTFGFQAPSGSMTALQKVGYPLRWTLSHISPWLASRTVGGVSLMVIGATPAGLKRFGA